MKELWWIVHNLKEKREPKKDTAFILINLLILKKPNPNSRKIDVQSITTVDCSSGSCTSES